MKSHRPFHRSAVIFAAIAFAMSLPPGAAQAEALSMVPHYKSRGKGGKHPHTADSGVAKAKRAAVKARNQATHKRHCR